MKQYGYNTWEITVEECVIRALSIKIMNAMVPSLSTDNSIQREHNYGFIFVRNFYDELHSYEKSRVTFQKYLPKILSNLKRENNNRI